MIVNKVGITLVANSIFNTSRIFKISRFLTESGRIGDLTIIGFWSKGLQVEEQYLGNVHIRRKKSLKQYFPSVENAMINRVLTLISIVPFFIGFFWTCLRKKPEVIYCHDVILLPVALLTKIFISSTIIYMPHELETQETGKSQVVNFFLERIEAIGMRYVKHTTVVSPDILTWYKETYNCDNVSLIRNIPDFDNVRFSGNKKLRDKLNLLNTDIVFIYQGLIEKSRGVLEVADAFLSLSNKHKHIVFMGYGPDTSIIESLSNEYMNIHYIPAVEPNDIWAYTSDADIGVFFIAQPISKSYEYSLPNKYFEYVKSGIPILISNNLVSIKSEIESLSTGWSIDSSDLSLLQFLNCVSKEEIDRIKEKVSLARDNYNWANEVKILLKF